MKRKRRPQFASAKVSWDKVPVATGYKVFFGIKSKTYPYVRDAGSNLSYNVATLSPGVTYYFAAKSYNAAGASPYSNEVVHRA